MIDTKINRIIEDRLTEPTNVNVEYCYEGYIKDRKCIVDRETGEHIQTRTNATFTITFTMSGQIILKKDNGNETVIASV